MSKYEWQDHLISKLNIQLKPQKENLNLQDQQLEKLIYVLWKITPEHHWCCRGYRAPKGRCWAREGPGQQDDAVWSKGRWPTKVQSRYSNFWALYMSSATLKTVEKNKHVRHETWHFRTKTRLVKSKNRLFRYCGLFNFTWWLLLNSYPKSKSN